MIIKSIVVRIIEADLDEDHVKAARIVFKAKAHHTMNDDSRLQIQSRIADYLEKKYPALDFKLVEVGPKQMNVVCVGPTKEAVA